MGIERKGKEALLFIGFDVDGVIARSPVGLHVLLAYGPRVWNFLLKSPVGTLAYKRLRFADENIRELIQSLRANGHKIVIITYVIGGKAKAIEWLEANKVPFDRIATPSNGESPLSFKTRVVRETKCGFFVESHRGLARRVGLKEPGVRVIHYRREKDLTAIRELI